MANQFLIKETMLAMRGLMPAEITALENGTYDGVQLLAIIIKAIPQRRLFTTILIH